MRVERYVATLQAAVQDKLVFVVSSVDLGVHLDLALVVDLSLAV